MRGEVTARNVPYARSVRERRRLVTAARADALAGSRDTWAQPAPVWDLVRRGTARGVALVFEVR
jgi:hypothetical protein